MELDRARGSVRVSRFGCSLGRPDADPVKSRQDRLLMRRNAIGKTAAPVLPEAGFGHQSPESDFRFRTGDATP
jgi:hypothetical protein